MYQPNEESDLAPIEQPRTLTPITDAPPNRASLPQRMPRWFLPAVVAVLTLALVATGAWGFITANDLSSARETVEQQSQRIAGLQTDLAQEQTRGDGLAASVANLQARVKNQDACISALATDAETQTAIAAKQTTIHNLTAEGSLWVEASDARNAAMNAALEDYYQAYLAAFRGSYSTSNTWIVRGNAQVSEVDRQLASMNGEIAVANQLLHEVDLMLQDYATGSGIDACTTPSSASSS